MSFGIIFNTAKAFCIKHTPEIALGLGLAATTGAVVWSNYVSYKKLPLIINYYEVDCEEHKEDLEDEYCEYTEEEYKHDICKRTGKLVLELAKNYCGPVALFAAGTFLTIKSHCALRGQVTALTAAVAALSNRGEQTTENDIPWDDESCEHGSELSKKLEGHTACSTFMHSDDNFAEGCNTPTQLLEALAVTEENANNKLCAHGYIFWNDILLSMGLKPTPAGWIYGWVDKGGETKVDLGLDKYTHDELAQILYDRDYAILMTPNCVPIIDIFQDYMR